MTKKKKCILLCIFVVPVIASIISFATAASSISVPLCVAFLMGLAALAVLKVRTQG